MGPWTIVGLVGDCNQDKNDHFGTRANDVCVAQKSLKDTDVASSYSSAHLVEEESVTGVYLDNDSGQCISKTNCSDQRLAFMTGW